MTNPHLRASLAEVLEAALPLQHDELQVNIPTSCREESFRNFPDIGHLAIAVIQLFVDIEFTGTAMMTCYVLYYNINHRNNFKWELVYLTLLNSKFQKNQFSDG